MKKTRAPKPVWEKTFYSIDEIPLVCTLQDIAILLRVGEDTVRSKIRSGEIKGFLAGDRIRVMKPEILKYMGYEMGRE